MFNKNNIWLITIFSTLFLTACAGRTVPENDQAPILTASDKPIESAKSPGKTEVPDSAVDSGKNTDLLEMLACTERVERLQPSLIASELRQLNAKLQVSPGPESSVVSEQPLQKFLLACLLSRESANDAQLARAQSLLEALLQEVSREEERHLVQLLGRTVSLQRRLHQYQAKLSGLQTLNRELLEKIEQLKGLERDLDVTNLPTQEPVL